jgi:hypothetical protein
VRRIELWADPGLTVMLRWAGREYEMRERLNEEDGDVVMW